MPAQPEVKTRCDNVMVMTSFPVNQVLKLPSEESGVQDSFYFIFFFTVIGKHWWRRRGGSPWNGILRVGKQQRDVKDRVYFECGW